MQEYVLGFLFNKDFSQVVLIRKNSPEWQKGKLNGVGGKIEINEPAVHAMTREFKEETDINVVDWSPFSILSGDDWKVYCFYATHSNFYNLEFKWLPHEPLEVCAVDKLPSSIISNLNWLIPMAIDFSKGAFSIVNIGYY